MKLHSHYSQIKIKASPFNFKPLRLSVLHSCMAFAGVTLVGTPFLGCNDVQAQVANGWDCRMVNNLWHCGASNEDNSEFLEKRAAIKSTAPTTKARRKQLAEQIPEATFIPPMGPTGGTAVNVDKLQPSSPVLTEQWSNCANPPAAEVDRATLAAQNESDDSTHIEADAAEAPNKDEIEFTGNVVISRNIQRLTADRANYDKNDELFTASGNVVISEPGVIFRGSRANYFAETKQGRLDNSSYELPTRPAQGRSNSIQFEPGTISLLKPTYSSCPADAESWVLKADKMDLNTDEGYGTGKHVVAYFKGVPFAYTPYIRFPLNDERSSGFLFPSIGYSSKNGADVSVPWYWNIAPNMDATFTPRILSKRGLMLGTEFRYLGENQRGQIYAEFINDSDYDETREAEEIVQRGDDISRNRGAISAQYQARLGDKWFAGGDFNYASDNYYLDDFGNNLKDRSENHLLREGYLRYVGDIFNFSAKAQGYQALVENTNTYSRLPQLLFSGYTQFSPGGYTFGTGFHSEAVRFEKNWDFSGRANEGHRYFLRPFIDMPLRKSYGYIKPKLSLDMVSYDLTETAIVGADEDHSRFTPILSIDSGLFFERDLNLFNTAMQQTLEPRLYYLYVPKEDQDDLPIFDTAENRFSFNQLFRENRFSGIDRLGDANQLTAALTTRFYDDNTGAERFRASIGQIFYFRDREVQLSNNSVAVDESTSAIAAEVASQFLPHWNTSLSLMYDPHESQVDTSTFRLQYKSDPYHIVNFDYTHKDDGFDSENYEQTDISAYWKIAPQWRGLARWNYSLKEKFSLESMLGVEYDSCCYALRLVVSREQDYENDDPDNRVMLQMHFKGLSSIGNISDRKLADDIPGFEPVMD